MSAENFIEKAQLVHKDIYVYDEVQYVNNRTKVKIVCKVHGVFEQTPSNHLAGQGCPTCNSYKRLDTNSFIEKAQQIHKGQYDYSLVHYVNHKTPIKIICKKHGVFKQKPSYHLKGHGCYKCGGSLKSDTESFIKKAQAVHSGLYNYSETVYINNTALVDIICNRHGIFQQTPNNHLKGEGCPICKSSKGEIQILNWLKIHNIIFEQQKVFNNLGNYRYDFYIPSYNMLIEYNGIQHYQNKPFFFKNDHDFHYQKHRDWIKRKFAKEQGICLLVIPYWEFNNIESILDKKISPST